MGRFGEREKGRFGERENLRRGELEKRRMRGKRTPEWEKERT
jgi:hypothetical protein